MENLDHLGIVAAIVDKLGLVELADEELGTHKLQHISPGQVLKGMILNGLGFVSAPLYLFSEFFQGKPVEHLLGPGIRAEHLNDDRLGRVLDQLFECGTTSFFLRAALQAVERFGVAVEQMHLDSTSFAVDGEYPSAEAGDEPRAIQICRGYSRDHRPELKQFLVNLICSADGGILLWLKVGHGNETAAIHQVAKLHYGAGILAVEAKKIYPRPRKAVLLGRGFKPKIFYNNIKPARISIRILSLQL
jgi:transposase